MGWADAEANDVVDVDEMGALVTPTGRFDVLVDRGRDANSLLLSCILLLELDEYLVDGGAVCFLLAFKPKPAARSVQYPL